MKFEEILKDQDCINVMDSIAKKYGRLLSKDEIKSFKLEAAWEASEKYDPNHPSQMKFTTYLGNCLKFKILLDLRTKRIKITMPMKNISNFKEYSSIIDLMDCLNPKEKILCEQRYIYNYSIQELADKNNISRQAMKNKFDKIKKKIAGYYQIKF